MRLVIAILASAILHAAEVRPVPPPGVAVSETDRTELTAGLDRLRKSIDSLRGVALVSDVQIFHDAVRSALMHNEFFKPEEIGRAKELLRLGQTRADELAAGKPAWTAATGLVVRGYVSKIDGSVQPYGLVVPASYNPALPWRWRLDAWFHGRNETLSEVNFLYDRMRNPGEFTPANTIVLHLYGRYCNANKFAGEVDLFEALDAVKKAYNIDDNRIAVRGFSMGGAAAWHIAAHHAGLWAAAAPGAGFAETPEFLRMTPADIAATPEWQRKLWHLYNATDYAENFSNLPVAAYNGDQDGQKQAADVMARQMSEEGMSLKRIVGPQTGHRYHPSSKVEIDAIVDPILARGRNPYPRRIRFTTYTLRYNRMKWVVIDSLAQHWDRARIDAEINKGGREVQVKTTNVTAFHLETGAGSDLLEGNAAPDILIDGQRLKAPSTSSDGSWTAAFRKAGTKWTVAAPDDRGLRKKHGLQGPVDDAFMDSFLFVVPSGETTPWVRAEQERAIREWRRQWRGEARVKRDTEVTAEDIASSNLVAWGDPATNALIARAASGLPIKWTEGSLAFRGATYNKSHVPVLIYPNPLNPSRYIVLNSGPTQREFDYLNNARQVPRLPDYAIIDTSVPPDEKTPGRIVTAGFFDESWK